MIKVTSKSILVGAFVLLVAQGLAQGYDVAAYVWPAYQPEPRWTELGLFKAGKGEWQSVWEAKPKWKGHCQPLKPLWGYEDESDPKVVAKKIDAAVSHGVNVFVYDWYWYGGRPFLENAVDKGFLGAPNNGKMKFYLMWANHHVNWLWDNTVEDKKWNAPRWRAWVSAEEFRALTRRWIEKYFSRPNYYRIKGRPVLMIYELSTFVEGVGGMEAAKNALADFRSDCAQAGLGGVHLMVCDFKIRAEQVRELGIDSATIYNFIHWSSAKGDPDYSDWSEKGARRFDIAKAELGLPCYFAHASVGWDTNPRYPASWIDPVVADSTPAKFEVALRRAKDWCDRNTPEGCPRLVTINSWNEWTEGSYLEPDQRFGYGYLEAIKRVFAEESTQSHRRTVRQAIGGSVGTETAERYLADPDPQVRRHALYAIWERDPKRGCEKAKGLRGDADKSVARLAADILGSNRNVSKVFSGVPLSQDKTVDHEILRIKTIVPKGGRFALPTRIASDAVELWFAEPPKTKVVVSVNGVQVYEFDPVITEGRAFRADVTRAVRWAAENAVRVTDEKGAEKDIPFEVEVLKCGG